MILIGTELYSSRKVPNINLTRALIFIVGNVDAAYDIHNNFNTDISADEFRKISEKVTIVEIKDSLAKSFRSEHIARLGNTHIIFPSLSKRSYQEIIQLYLDEYSIQIKKLYNINLVFEKTIKEILYKENVYPTLGVRPVISGINDMIKSSFASSLLYKDTNKIEADTIEYSYKNKEIEVFYYLNGSLVGGTSHPVTLRLEKLRENKKDDRQALTAVHESGHMIVRILLTNKLPIAVFSVTTDDESDGFTELEVNDEELINVEYIEKYVKLLLGGRCAEIAIFGGGDTLAPGASNDLERANEILLKKHREWGLGGSLLVKDITPKYNGVAREWFQNSVQPFVEEELERLSRETLKLLETHRPLLIAMSKYLMNHASMSQKIMLKLIKENSSIDIDKLLLKDNSKINYGYRDKLLNL
jgi:cell division protease FtsH